MATAMDSGTIPADLVDPFTRKINKIAKSSQHAYWYVRRAEQYLQATALRPVSLHTRAEVTAWFMEPGRNAALTEWQFRQCVEAVDVLIRAAPALALRKVDWRYWLDGAVKPANKAALLSAEKVLDFFAGS